MLEVLLPALICPVLICVGALLLDRLIGEPKFHPLIWFGKVAAWLEQRLNNRQSRFRGAIAVFILISLPVGLVWLIQSTAESRLIQIILDIVILTFVIGWQSMKEHAMAVAVPLLAGDLENARNNLSMIVSRQTDGMNETEVAGSTIESVLENGHDCVFASLFWYALLGPAGALLHRLVNTLDAMWGYKNERYLKFGCFAARFDDLLGWLPARLTAICYAISGSSLKALNSWRNQIGTHKSLNAGLVMATGAGALDIVIGGPAVYHGVRQDKPYLGVGDQVKSVAKPADIKRAIRLIQKSLVVWLVLFTLLLFVFNQIWI
ncbi:adenosylcobinamide-phosphate synthase CbiB [Candidatus Spongiihabitans sp.]|uniref:adenosylcobinamide-phosphate synthase CbiB n=1 Tax=Candidatus Spongiihabitans sp. TaxID=3101308 RepID=UPI003C6F2D42